MAIVGIGVLLCVLSIPVGMRPKPILGNVIPGRLKPGMLNLLEAATGVPVVAGAVGVAEGAMAAAAFCFRKDEKPLILPAVSELVWIWLLLSEGVAIAMEL